jgi:hypothetical protein
MFDRLLGRCNDVGLLAEEYDTVTQRLVGISPRFFPILRLSIRRTIVHATKPCEQRSGNLRLAEAAE